MPKGQRMSFVKRMRPYTPVIEEDEILIEWIRNLLIFDREGYILKADLYAMYKQRIYICFFHTTYTKKNKNFLNLFG